jgi:DNA repair protein RecO (recombination protein O)
MLHTVKGIVLNTIKYTDASVITKIYTDAFGLQSYLVNGVHAKKSATKINLLQPLSLLDLVVYNKGKRQLQRIKEMKCEQPFTSIPFDVAKRCIVIFLDEVLCKSLHEEEQNPLLFNFITNALQILDLKSDNCANFHLLFLLHLSKHLGFYPQENYNADRPYFDLRAGQFKSQLPNHPDFTAGLISNKLSLLLNSNFESISSIALANLERKELLEKILKYYELHIATFKDVNSHLILQEVIA